MAGRGDMAADPNDRPGAARGQKGPAQKGQGKKGKGKWLLHFTILLVLFLCAGSGLAWYMMTGTPQLDGNGDAPLILADKAPFKVRPQDPGGMEVPGRDRLVYDRLEGDGSPPAPEALLPPPEEPLPLPQGNEEVIAEFKPAAPATEPAASQLTMPDQPAPPPPAAPTTPAAPPVVVETPPAAPAAVPAPVTPEAQPTVNANTNATTNMGTHMVQIASLRSEDAVRREWARLQKAHADVLGDYALFIQRADLGADKGVYYRLRVGTMSKAAADALCVTLASRNLGCLPVAGGN